MACVALTSLMATIQHELLQPNHRVSLFDEKPLKSVFEKLSSLEAFLKKEYNNGGAPIPHLQIKIRDFALKAEDDIEIQLRNTLLPKDGGEHKQKAHAKLYQILQEVAKDASELLKIINSASNEVEVANDSQLENILSGGSLQCSPELDDIMVGRHNEFTSLRNVILNDIIIPQRTVLPIFGVPGLGKTTFCKKLYANEGVVSHFSIRGWVTIPRRYNVQQLLRHLLQSMKPSLNEIDMGSTVFQLKVQLHKHLKCKRYLIVLDDVPNTVVWDDIQQCFPDESNGSRILLTTLFSDVAKYISKDFYSLPFLTDNESCDLFCHRFSLKQYMSPKFKEIAKNLIEECKGLPRSIVMVANRLSKCNYTLKEWKKIEKELLSLGILHKDAQHSIFPKHSQIQVERLIKLWIAEGFVKPLRCLPLEDIAYRYLDDLRSRGLVDLDMGKAFKPKTSYCFKRVPPLPLGDLVFLRYLSVPQWFGNLDDVVSNNSNLQTLIVSGVDQSTIGAPTLHLPSKIWELQHLRHLELGDMYMVDPPNMVKEHLQTLVCAMPIHFKKEVYYCRFPSIRKLKILYKDLFEAGCTLGSCGNPTIILENFEDLLRLETLTVIVSVGRITLLEQLGFPASLKELRLSGTNFPVKVLRVIGQLPRLRVLKLENAFYGRVWEVAEGRFCELEELVLEARNLERWVTNGSHFPNLRHIVLKCCYFLEEIPPDFAEGPLLLFSIKLEQCPPSVVTSAKWIQQRMRYRFEVPGIKLPEVTIDGKILSYTDKEESEEDDQPPGRAGIELVTIRRRI
ncbi:PREDICTED: putative late blight resistance protein homolog R1C-3 [Ipomoea nil]|uniref:putative late blight resistance protein homolog R1C-3 n=1 Tax=Ipomoea nil TaxID=35883 RepID=UPI000901ED52|nr:PREDICTED: putative late blight resistance protein homolog R1C-3 [Ipomoea nil]